MATHNTSAAVLERLGVDSLPDEESWLGVRATRIVESVEAQIEGATEEDISYIYGLGVRVLGNHLLWLVESGHAVDHDDAIDVFETLDPNLEAFVEIGASTILEIVSVEVDEDDDEDFYASEEFADTEKVLVEISDWSVIAKDFHIFEGKVVSGEVLQESSTAARQVGAMVFVMLNVLGSCEFVGTRLAAPRNGVEFILDTLDSLHSEVIVDLALSGYDITSSGAHGFTLEGIEWAQETLTRNLAEQVASA